MKPKLLNDLFINKDNDRILYLNTDAPDWITINLKYKPIFDLFDGNCSDDEIFKFVSQNYEKEFNVLIPQLRSFFKTSNILTNNYPQKLGVINNAKAIPIPKYIYLTLTDNCNLSCKYCYATERKHQKDVRFEQWINFIDQILETTNECVFVFTGGEPLLVKYVYKIASYTKSKNCSNILLTNGTQINSIEDAKIISNLFSLVKISLDSIKEPISNELRGNNVIDIVQYAYNLLKSINANVEILATVSAMTKNDVDSFAKHFNYNVSFQPFYEMGRGRKNGHLSISGEEYYESLTKADIFHLLPSFHKNIHNYRNRPFKRCAFAKEEISIDASGSIFPCHMLHYEALNCGNLNDSVFENIYYDSDILERLRDISVDNIPQCRICVFRNFCGGACRARVDFVKNGISGVNEFCDFEKKAILDALMYSYG